MKKAVLSIDVEDWYHLEYFDRRQCDTSVSMMDGLEQYLKILTDYSITSSFFVLNEIAKKQLSFFQDLSRQGFDITMSAEAFRDDVSSCFETMMRINGKAGFGYRAPCFSLDRERLDILQQQGFAFDASRMDFSNHPLYGSIDMDGFSQRAPSIFQKQNFFEFEATTTTLLGRRIPISGGAYLRIIPWQVKRYLISRYLSSGNLYVLYIHPFELSKRDLPAYPPKTRPSVKFRFSAGRRSCGDRLRKVIELLMSCGYEFSSMADLRAGLLK